ncbi:uncharacterized protein LOC128211125 [Mya arenaria]|uniref:uncharacterized protein LOC128211125 n=1 Tax=Mya arenaria TaxID=6604 RepID=UPI0022E26C61|nr:uncharacterized protein LOC128211125 [Mya arenaria]
MSLPDKSTGDYIANLSKTWHSQTGAPNPLTQLAPRKPTVFIRGMRWILFASGLFYGFTRLRYLTEKEKPVTELYETLTDFKAEREKKYRREYGASEAKALYFYVFGEDKKDD